VVAVSGTSVSQARPGACRGKDTALSCLDFAGDPSDFGGSPGRDDHDTVVVAAHGVPGADGDTVNDDRDLDGHKSNAVFPGPHEPPGTPDRVAVARSGRSVPAHAVDDGR
jgi:hypothetical protein